MEEIKNIEINDEAIEVAEGFVEERGGITAGKAIAAVIITGLVIFGIKKTVDYVKAKKAAKATPEISKPIEVEHTDVVDDESEIEE